MERSEPSLIPQWLKAAAGSGVASPHVSQSATYQDEGSQFLTRHRVSQQFPVGGGGQVDSDSPWGSTLSDRTSLPISRRGPSTSSSSSSIERTITDRENFSQVWSYTGLTRSSSLRSHGTPELDRDGSKGDVQNDRDWDWEGDRDLWLREKDRSLFGTDERERLENGVLCLSNAGTSGKNEAETMLRRSMSMGISHRTTDRKMNDVVNPQSAMPSVSGGLATSMQKAAFERNFPSLGTDEKQGGPPRSPGTSSPRSLWQGSSRTDLGRASSPGLTCTFGGSISVTSSSSCGGADLWSSALAEAPSSNGNMHNNSLPANVLAASNASLLSPGTSSAASVNGLNMAEALIQNPPRVRTPPQLSIESQRLEVLALKQSRQLIPMTPSLPKAMSSMDKAKSKSSRTLDGMVTKGNQPLGSLQSNSPHRSLAPARPDTPKLSQGKLLVLKSSKDNNATVSGTTKSEGSNSSQVPSFGSIGLTASAMSAAGVSTPSTVVLGQRRQSLDRRAPFPGVAGVDAVAGLRAKDLGYVGEDKRSSLQAQNRIDFFNALRRKAADNSSVSVSYNKSESSCQQKSDLMNLSKAVMPEESAISLGHGSEAKANGVGQDPHSTEFLSEAHSNGEVKYSPGNGLILDETGGLVKEPSAVDSLEGDNAVPLPGDSEEEEAAFMRSLGWEENAEDSELTEEEINAFYQMRERKKVLNSRGHCRLRNFDVEHCVGSSRTLSSSDSESDDELHV